MKQVVDKFGTPINGLFRSPDGSLQVKAPEQLSKYRRELKLANRVEELESKVDSIHEMLKILIDRK